MSMKELYRLRLDRLQERLIVAFGVMLWLACVSSVLVYLSSAY